MIEPVAERRDLDGLLDQLLAFAREMLRQQGAVHPFGAVTRSDGRMRLVASSGGAGESDEERMSMVLHGMRRQALAGEIRAAGVCYEAHVAADDGSIADAIAVALEDDMGDTALVYMPYTRGRLTGVKFDEITVSGGEPRVFARL